MKTVNATEPKSKLEQSHPTSGTRLAAPRVPDDTAIALLEEIEDVKDLVFDALDARGARAMWRQLGRRAFRRLRRFAGALAAIDFHHGDHSADALRRFARRIDRHVGDLRTALLGIETTTNDLYPAVRECLDLIRPRLDAIRDIAGWLRFYAIEKESA